MPSEEDITNPVTLGAPSDQQADELAILSEESSRYIADKLRTLDQCLATASTTNTKTKKSILAKGCRPDILKSKAWFSPAHLRDSFRFKTVIERFSQIVESIAYVNCDEVAIIKLDCEKMLTPSGWGWRAVMVDLRFPNKQLVEWYLPLTEMDEANMGGNHALFEKWRDKTEQELINNYQEFMKDREQSRRTYEEAFKNGILRQGLDPEKIADCWKPFEALILKLQ